MRRMGRLAGAGTLALVSAVSVGAQNVITLQGGTPIAAPVTAAPMAVRELPNGRVLIATAENGLLLRVDPRNSRVDTILKPGSVAVPPSMAAMGMPTEMLGASMGYVAVPSPANAIVFSNPMAPDTPLRVTATGDTAGQAAAPRVLDQTALVGVDAAGNSYVIGMGMSDPMAVMAGGSPFAATVPLLRLRPGTAAPDTVAMIANPALQATRQRQEVDGTSMRILLRPADGAPVDGLAVFEDGSVGIFSGADYRLRRIAPDGSERVFAPLPQLERPVTAAMRRASIDTTAYVAALTLKFMDGMMQQMLSQMGDIPEEAKAMMPRIAVVVDTVQPFAELLPPLTTVLTTVGDRAWVSVPADLLGRSAHYDVVRADGTLLARVRPPEGEQIIAVSAAAVYTTKQEGTAHQLRRYAVPAALR
jgi:hypothetical protein